MKKYRSIVPLLILVCITNTHGQGITVVSPNRYESLEAPNQSLDNFDGRSQYIIRHSQFDDLPDGGGLITEISFRPDENVQVDEEMNFDRIETSLSITQVEPLEMSNVFADNITGTPVVVHDGPFSATAIHEQPSNGETRPFDFRMRLHTPFFYDPAEGNLLIDDIWHRPDIPLARMDVNNSVDLAESRAIWSGHNGHDSPVARNGRFSHVIEFAFAPYGDFDGNGLVDGDDVNGLMEAIQNKTNLPSYDLEADDLINHQDLTVWVQRAKQTWFGDANLDGEFNSGDLVRVFQAGHYEDDVTLNSGWAEGDWNADGEFTSGDLVVAFQDGGFEQGPRLAAVVVPEPSNLFIAIGFVLILPLVRHRL